MFLYVRCTCLHLWTVLCAVCALSRWWYFCAPWRCGLVRRKPMELSWASLRRASLVVFTFKAQLHEAISRRKESGNHHKAGGQYGAVRHGSSRTQWLMLCIKLVSIMSASGLQHTGSSEHRHGARADRGSTAPHLRSEPYERLARPAFSDCDEWNMVPRDRSTSFSPPLQLCGKRHVLLCLYSDRYKVLCTNRRDSSIPKLWAEPLHWRLLRGGHYEGHAVYPPNTVMYVSYRCILCPWAIALSSAIASMYSRLIIFEDAFILAWSNVHCDV